MLGINCLLKNVPAVQQIRDVVEVMVGDSIEKHGEAKFPSIYNSIRKAGIEIDAESLGNIYNGLYGGYNDGALSSITEVEDHAGTNFAKQLDKIVDEIQGNADVPGEQKIGFDSPEKHAVNSISRMFQNAIFGTTARTKSDMVKMQDLVEKAAKANLPKTAAIPKTLTDSLTSFFDTDAIAFKTLGGQLNTMKDLHEAVKKQVENYVNQAAAKLEDDEAEVFREQWENYTKAFINSSYDIVLGKGDQNSLVNESLKQIQIDGVNIVDLNGSVKWTALIEHNDPDTISEKVKQLFADGFTDKAGQVVKYTPQQAQRIGDYFQRIYEKKLNDAKQRALQNNRAKNMSPKNIISDFLKDRGFFNLVKDKDGKLNFTQADWDGALKSIKQQLASSNYTGKIGDQQLRGLDVVQQKLRTFLNSQTKPDGSPKFTANQKKLIEDAFVETALAKLTPATAEPTSIERLIALDRLNSGNAFNDQTQQALNKVVGVSGLNQEALTKVQELAKAAASILNDSVVTGSTNPNPGVNRGAHAYTALVEIDRKIKEILRQFKIDNSKQQQAVKYIADLMGAASVSLLINPNNGIENITTQTFTNIAESVTMAFTNPRLFAKTFGKLQGEFWGQWLNYANGGASNEIANESDLSADIQSSERLRVRGALDEIRDKGVLKGLASVMAKSIQYAVSIFSRVFMNSFDAATTTSLMRKRMIQSTYDALKSQGYSASEVMQIMDKALVIPPSINNEIISESNRIEGILKAAGLPVNSIMMGQIRRDMRLSAYEDVIRGEALKQGHSMKHATEATKALIESSQKQAKALGGKRQLPTKDLLSLAIYKSAEAIIAPQRTWFASSRKAEEQGELGRAARLQLAASAYQNIIGKFVGGVANFMNLALSATPVGFVQSALLRKQSQQFQRDHAGAADIFKGNPEDIKKYAELHGLMRSLFTRAVMGSTAMAAFIAKALISKAGDDEEKESQDWFANLMATKSGRRFIQKHLPLGIAIAGPMIYKKDGSHALDMAFDMINTYTGKDFDTYNNLLKSLKIAGDDEDERSEIFAKFWGNMTFTYNVNQPEQMVKFIDVAKSMFDSDKISTVEENEDISSEVYKNAEGIIDNYLINGAIDAFRRTISSEKHYNRYTEAAKGDY